MQLEIAVKNNRMFTPEPLIYAIHCVVRELVSVDVCCVLATESLLQRMTIVGVLLSFRCLAQEALIDVRHIFCIMLHAE